MVSPGVSAAKQHGLIGLRARVRLHVHVIALEKLLGAIAGQVFDHVHKLASAVVALAGIALGIFVGQRSGGGGHHRRARRDFRMR